MFYNSYSVSVLNFNTLTNYIKVNYNSQSVFDLYKQPIVIQKFMCLFLFSGVLKFEIYYTCSLTRNFTVLFHLLYLFTIQIVTQKLHISGSKLAFLKCI